MTGNNWNDIQLNWGDLAAVSALAKEKADSLRSVRANFWWILEKARPAIDAACDNASYSAENPPPDLSHLFVLCAQTHYDASVAQAPKNPTESKVEKTKALDVIILARKYGFLSATHASVFNLPLLANQCGNEDLAKSFAKELLDAILKDPPDDRTAQMKGNDYMKKITALKKAGIIDHVQLSLAQTIFENKSRTNSL